MSVQYHLKLAPGDVAPHVLLPGDPGRVPLVASLWDVDDATSSYTPPRSERPRWVSQGWGTSQQPRPQTPEHWFDPATQRATPQPTPTQADAAPAPRS